MNEFTELHAYLLRGYEECEERILALERRHRLTPIGFGILSLPKSSGERVQAMQVLLRLRIERLESLHIVNS